MTVRRIPSSLKWLLDKRSRLEGELLKVKKEGCAMQQLCQFGIDKLNARIEVQEQRRQKYLHEAEVRAAGLRQQIEAVESTLFLHEIQIDTTTVAPIKTHDGDRVVPHGHVTRLILDCLRKADGRICLTTELIMYVVVNSGREIDTGGYQQMRIAVRKRLNFLARAGVILRHHATKTQFVGKWSIPRPAPSPDDLKGRFEPL